MGNSENKLILRNTIIVYLRMIIVTAVGLFSSRFVLQALGASDYGLYNVVAGLIAMLNFISTAMSTTTRRFINIEMGKRDGNLNKVFNVSLFLHIGFALLILIVAESVGVWYIDNVLNVTSGKESDAMFVFQISTIIACLGIINVPYQSLIEAYEKFALSAIVDIMTTLLKLLLIIILIYYPYNALRFYAICICCVTLVSFLLYHLVCFKNWPQIIKHKIYRKEPLYKEILVFNNYTALGAVASIGKTQGSNLLINFFFGTVINAAFAIAYQLDSYVYMFVNKLTLASNPQIAKNYSLGDKERAQFLVEKNTKYSVLIMTIFYFTVAPNLNHILGLWLKPENVPPGALILCVLTLTDALVRSFSEGTNGIIQASGKIKWFQVANSIVLLSVLPVSFVLFKIGYSVHWLLIFSVISSIAYRVISLVLMRFFLNYEIMVFIEKACVRPLIVIILLTLLTIVLQNLSICDNYPNTSIIIFFLCSVASVYFVGLDNMERRRIKSILHP